MAEGSKDLRRYFIPNEQGSPTGLPSVSISQVRAVAHDSLVAAYPELSGYKDAFMNRVYFGTLPEVQVAERTARPESRLVMYQHFLQLGFPKSFLGPLAYLASEDQPFFPNYDKGEIYLPRILQQNLASRNREVVAQNVMYLGGVLIRGSLRALAWRVSPDKFNHEDSALLLDIIGSHFESFIANLKEASSDYDEELFEDNLPRVKKLFTFKGMREHQARFVGVGGDIFYLFGGQNYSTSEVRIADDFDQSTMGLISKRAEAILEEESRKRFKLPRIQKNLVVPNFHQASNVHTVLGLEGSELMRAFIHSQIPRMILTSSDPRIDPYKYGQLSQPEDWIKLLVDKELDLIVRERAISNSKTSSKTSRRGR